MLQWNITKLAMLLVATGVAAALANFTW